jgi:ABC-type lipoprotein release transport system permease subunit
VLSYWVSSRSRELGLLQALGASAADLRRLVVRQATGAVGVGLLAGVAGAIAAGRTLRGLLFRVEPTDPATLAGVVVLVLLATLLACLLPARRAGRVQPAAAMRDV